MRSKTFATVAFAGAALLFAGSLQGATGGSAPARLPFPLIERFEHFGLAQGLPAWKVHCVLADKGRVWVGTTKGLAVLEGGKFTVIGPDQGLSHSVVTALAVDPANGDLWAGTLRGLNRISAGKIETFTQTNSGMPNNVVYSVTVGHGADRGCRASPAMGSPASSSSAAGFVLSAAHLSSPTVFSGGRLALRWPGSRPSVEGLIRRGFALAWGSVWNARTPSCWRYRPTAPWAQLGNSFTRSRFATAIWLRRANPWRRRPGAVPLNVLQRWRRGAVPQDGLEVRDEDAIDVDDDPARNARLGSVRARRPGGLH